jgi:hypothetical protein
LDAPGEYGEYRSSGFHRVERNKDGSQLPRAKDWREFANGDGVPLIFCHHLGSDVADKWGMKYDKGLRGEETGEFESVNADGRDVYVLQPFSKLLNLSD